MCVSCTHSSREARVCERESVSVQRRVSARADRYCMCRRQRQLDELRDLCRSGAVVRAIDLAFEHFACFGRDADVIDLLAGTIEDTEAPERARRRFAELRASHQ